MRSLSTRATGLLILALGLWGGLVPFVGHYFHFALGPDKSWTWTTGRLYLSVLPAAAAVLGGLMLIGAGPRPGARVGALLAIAAGIWFVIGPDVSHLWNASGAQGAAHGSTTVRVLEMLAYHTALGALLAALGGYALPRFAVAQEVVAGPAVAARPRRVSERRAAGDTALAGGAVAADREPATTTMPARERGMAAAPATSETREERAADTGAEPSRGYAAEPVAAGDAETGAAPAAGRSAQDPQVPARERDAAPTAATPAAGEPAPAAAGSTPAADRTARYDDAASAPDGADGYETRTRTVRRRRGGLLSGLFSGR
jgi:hypothetical protein